MFHTLCLIQSRIRLSSGDVIHFHIFFEVYIIRCPPGATSPVGSPPGLPTDEPRLDPKSTLDALASSDRGLIATALPQRLILAGNRAGQVLER
jgi:hypothetical protein